MFIHFVTQWTLLLEVAEFQSRGTEMPTAEIQGHPPTVSPVKFECDANVRSTRGCESSLKAGDQVRIPARTHQLVVLKDAT